MYYMSCVLMILFRSKVAMLFNYCQVLPSLNKLLFIYLLYLLLNCRFIMQYKTSTDLTTTQLQSMHLSYETFKLANRETFVFVALNFFHSFFVFLVCRFIRYFRIAQNALCLPAKILHKHCF